MRKLTYWCCKHLDDGRPYNIRAGTRKQAVAMRKEYGESGFSKPFKVQVEYHNALHLLQKCLGEGSIDEQPEDK